MAIGPVLPLSDAARSRQLSSRWAEVLDPERPVATLDDVRSAVVNRGGPALAARPRTRRCCCPRSGHCSSTTRPRRHGVRPDAFGAPGVFVHGGHTADALNVHENTARYRVKRLDEDVRDRPVRWRRDPGDLAPGPVDLYPSTRLRPAVGGRRYRARPRPRLGSVAACSSSLSTPGPAPGPTSSALGRLTLWVTMVSATTHGLVVTHLPVVPDPTADPGARVGAGSAGPVLLGHLPGARCRGARARHRADGARWRQGPHGYVSAGWYVNSPYVSTWNDVVAHVHGTANVSAPKAPWSAAG